MSEHKNWINALDYTPNEWTNIINQPAIINSCFISSSNDVPVIVEFRIMREDKSTKIYEVIIGENERDDRLTGISIGENEALHYRCSDDNVSLFLSGVALGDDWVGGLRFDPYWDNVVSLLRFDGDTTDSTGRIWEVTAGSPQFAPNSRSSEFGESILLASVDGLITPGGGNLAFGTEDFTIEGWFRPTKSASGFGGAFFLCLGINMGNGLSFSLDSLGRLEVRRSTANRLTVNTSIRDSSLSFLTICRAGNTLYIGVNGVVTSQGYSLFDHTYDGLVFIGNQGVNYGYSGEIDELRITKGVARYTEDFDPPTEPFPSR